MMLFNHCCFDWKIGIFQQTVVRFYYILNDVKIQKQMRGHGISKCKKDEFDGVSATNFGFMEKISDVFWL